jgi:hypothetical protein
MWTNLEETNLPNYYRLCLSVQKDLYNGLICCCRQPERCKYVFVVFSYLLAFTGIGHFFSRNGLKCWKQVLLKYGQFIMVCFGIWTEEAAEAYELDNIKETMCLRNDDLAMNNIIKSIIGARALLLQVFPLLAIASVAIITTCGSPLFLIGEKMNKRLPGLIITNPYELAKEREKQNFIITNNQSSKYWILYLRTIQVLFTESRLLLFIYYGAIVSFSVIILYDLDSTIIAYIVLLSIIIFYNLIYSFSVIIFMGEFFNIDDSDFRWEFRYS